MEFLEPFEQATRQTEGDNATLNKVLFSIDVLVKWFRTLLVSRLFLLIKAILTSYDRLSTLRIKSFTLVFKMDRRLLISGITNQTSRLTTLLLLFFTQSVVRSILNRLGKRLGLNQRLRKSLSFGKCTEKKLLFLVTLLRTNLEKSQSQRNLARTIELLKP